MPTRPPLFVPEGWSGSTVLIAASGPSQSPADLGAARGRCKVIAINDTWELCPWADALYACDERWWRHHQPRFGGLRVIGHGQYPNCIQAPVRGNAMEWSGPFIGGGGNSGFQALNLAVRWGAARVILTGYDFKNFAGHWFGPHPEGLTVTSEKVGAIWLDLMNRAAPDVLARCEVVNCTRDTALDCFPRMSLEEALG